jgi:hypothetical protein
LSTSAEERFLEQPSASYLSFVENILGCVQLSLL